MIDVFFSLVGSSCEKLVMLFVNDQTRNQLQKQREQKNGNEKRKICEKNFCGDCCGGGCQFHQISGGGVVTM